MNHSENYSNIFKVRLAMPGLVNRIINEGKRKRIGRRI